MDSTKEPQMSATRTSKRTTREEQQQHEQPLLIEGVHGKKP